MEFLCVLCVFVLVKEALGVGLDGVNNYNFVIPTAEVGKIGGVFLPMNVFDHLFRGELSSLAVNFLSHNPSGPDFWDEVIRQTKENADSRFLFIDPICDPNTRKCRFCCEVQMIFAKNESVHNRFQHFKHLHVVFLADYLAGRTPCYHYCRCENPNICLNKDKLSPDIVRDGFTVDVVNITDVVTPFVPWENRFTPPIYKYEDEESHHKSNFTLPRFESTLLALEIANRIVESNPFYSYFFTLELPSLLKEARETFQKNIQRDDDDDDIITDVINFGFIGDSVAWRMKYLLDDVQLTFDACLVAHNDDIHNILRKLSNKFQFNDLAMPGSSIFEGTLRDKPFDVDQIMKDLSKKSITTVDVSDTRFLRQWIYDILSEKPTSVTFDIHGVQFLKVMKKMRDAGVDTVYLQCPSLDKVVLLPSDDKWSSKLMNNGSSPAHYLKIAIETTFNSCKDNISACAEKMGYQNLTEFNNSNINNADLFPLSHWRSMIRIVNYGNWICPNPHLTKNAHNLKEVTCPISVGPFDVMLPDGMHPSGNSGRYIASLMLSHFVQDYYLRHHDSTFARTACHDGSFNLCLISDKNSNDTDAYLLQLNKFAFTGECVIESSSI